MKIAVITRHAITNYGSLLQAVATQQVISNLGHNCIIIDYIRKDELFWHRENTQLKRKNNWNKNIFRKTLYLLFRQPESIVSGIRFDKAQKEWLHLTSRYTSLDSLAKHPPIADIYMTGSDQVWGPVENGTYDSTYCLSFTEQKKIAYAASFGHNEMTQELTKYYQKWLSSYAHISVREDSAVQILDDIGIHADEVLDPTLLLDATYWNQYANEIKKKKYVLIYQLHNDKTLGKYAKKVAKIKGVSLLRISASFHQITREGRLICCPSIRDFLGYIKNAECIITDSFHGTAFALIFNTPFIEILPNNKTNIRNLSILRLTDLSDRILKDENDLSIVDKKIDFTYANHILEIKRQESLEILQKMIEN